jgi:serine/threonine protein kinase
VLLKYYLRNPIIKQLIVGVLVSLPSFYLLGIYLSIMKVVKEKLLDRLFMIQFLILVQFGKEHLLRLKSLLIVRFILTLDLLSKNPAKRMTIKELLEHPWFAKINKTDLPELRRKSRDNNHSMFKIYSITEQEK